MALKDAHVQRALLKLPLRRRWTFDQTPLDWDFSLKRSPLRPLDASAFDFPFKAAWRALLVFGEYDYAEGGGANPFLGIRKTDGAVYGLDFERDRKQMFLLNSDLDAFVATFAALDAHLAKGRRLPDDIERRLRAIDRTAYDRSDWKGFVGFVRGD
jgi:hypothetical protein